MSSDTESSYVKNTSEDYSTEPTDVEYPISKSSIPSYTKILVPDDGKEISNKALSQAIYVSNLSGAEIVILRIIEKVDKLGDTSVNISQDDTTMKDDEKDLKRNVAWNVSKLAVHSSKGIGYPREFLYTPILLHYKYRCIDITHYFSGIAE